MQNKNLKNLLKKLHTKTLLQKTEVELTILNDESSHSIKGGWCGSNTGGGCGANGTSCGTKSICITNTCTFKGKK